MLDSGRSAGVTSVRSLPQGRYIALDATGRAVICASSTAHNKTALREKDHHDARVF